MTFFTASFDCAAFTTCFLSCVCIVERCGVTSASSRFPTFWRLCTSSATCNGRRWKSEPLPSTPFACTAYSAREASARFALAKCVPAANCTRARSSKRNASRSAMERRWRSTRSSYCNAPTRDLSYVNANCMYCCHFASSV